jgi:hypothetical protein
MGMNSPTAEDMAIDNPGRQNLLAEAHRLAAAGGGVPAVMAGLQAAFALDEEAAGELAAAAFGLSAISLSEMSGHSLALTLASFAEFVRRQTLILEVGDAYLIATPNPFDAVLRDWHQVPHRRRAEPGDEPGRDRTETAEQMISRIKVLAELDIAERACRRTAASRSAAQGREIDFRVSIMPSHLRRGRRARILDKQSDRRRS